MDTLQLINDTADKMFADHCNKQLLDQAELGEFPAALWQVVVDNGFHQLGTAASGTGAVEMFTFMVQCGRYAVPLPIAETLLVNRWFEDTEQSAPASIGLIEGARIVQVPWGRQASRVAGVEPDSHTVTLVDAPRLDLTGANLAGEPRDAVMVQDARTIELADQPYAQLALARVNLIAGSLLRLLDLGIEFATDRQQFGRSISKFQAIQHALAVVAAEVAAAQRAAIAGVDALGDDRFVMEVAAAKARVGEAVGVAAEQVHQVLGAMGFTHEHRLHHFSRRAWAWRDEYGNEFEWQQRLGRHLAALGAEAAWPYIATRT